MTNLKVYLKGVLMGIADLIPGISGGTIALITGIYLKTITSVKNISLQFIFNLLILPFTRKNLSAVKRDSKKIDFPFLIVLVLGILTSLLLLSGVVKYLLNEFFAFTMIFFIGLIIASSKIMFDHIERHNTINFSFAAIGLAIGIVMAFVVPTVTTPSFSYIVFSGFLAISALFLPGISGSYILVILGTYEFMLGVISNIASNISFLVAFLIGAVIGVFVISRVVFFLFKKDKCKTLYFLLGLVIGSLLLPLRQISESVQQLSSSGFVIMFLLLVLGVTIVLWLHNLSKKNQKLSHQ